MKYLNLLWLLSFLLVACHEESSNRNFIRVDEEESSPTPQDDGRRQDHDIQSLRDSLQSASDWKVVARAYCDSGTKPQIFALSEVAEVMKDKPAEVVSLVNEMMEGREKSSFLSELVGRYSKEADYESILAMYETLPAGANRRLVGRRLVVLKSKAEGEGVASGINVIQDMSFKDDQREAMKILVSSIGRKELKATDADVKVLFELANQVGIESIAKVNLDPPVGAELNVLVP